MTEERKKLLDDMPCASFIINDRTDFRVSYGNGAFYDMIGYTEEEFNQIYGNRLSAVTRMEDMKTINSSLRECIQNRQTSVVIEGQICHKDGGMRWIRGYFYGIVDSPEVFNCLAIDITKYKEMESENHWIEARMEVIADEAQNYLFEYFIGDDEARCLTGMEQIFRRFPHLKEHFPFSLTEGSLMDEGDRVSLEKALTCLNQDGECSRYQMKVSNQEGDTAWMQLMLKAFTDSGSGRILLLGIMNDITRMKDIESSYIRECQCYQTMLADTVAHGEVDITDNRIIHMCGVWKLYNELADSITYQDLLFQFIDKVVHSMDREHYKALASRDHLLEAFQEGKTEITLEFRRIMDQNQMVWMEFKAYLFKDMLTGHLLAILCIKRIKQPTGQPEAEAAPSGTGEGGIDYPELERLMEEFGEVSYLIDANSYDFICGNRAFYRRIGMSHEECIGKKCFRMLQGRDSPCTFCSKVNWSTDKFYIWKNYNPVMEQEFLMKNKILEWNSRELSLCIAVDISNDKSIVDSLIHEFSEENIILSCIHKMSKSRDSQDAIQVALETISSFFKADHVLLWEGEVDSPSFKCLSEWTQRNRRPVGSKGSMLGLTVPKWKDKLNRRHLVYINSPDEALSYSIDVYRSMKDRGIENIQWVPVMDGMEFFGYISIANIHANFYNVSFMESLGSFIVRELTRRKLQEELTYAHYHDALTGLLNRNGYEAYTASYNPDEVESVGVVSADLNGLKKFNEVWGQRTGDEQIALLAETLKNELGCLNVFRLSGDEFVAVIKDMAVEEYEGKIASLSKALYKRVSLSVALGHVWENVEKELPALIHQATELMMYDKQCYYDNQETYVDSRRFEMLSDLMKSLSEKRFVVFLQPKVDIKTKRVIGAEALVRYSHMELGVIPPAKFIGVLEENCFIRYVDLFVLEEVFKMLERWKEEGRPLVVVSLNFSRLTLMEKGLLSSVETIAKRYDVPRRYVEIEITESVGEVGKEAMYRIIRDLRMAGFTISLDDFGTKYTNLSIVTDIDFDVLKIDRGLMNTLVDSETNRIVVRSVVSMCQAMGITVVAEGVESQDQERILEEMGCPMGQGYLYGKPLPVQDFERILG